MAAIIPPVYVENPVNPFPLRYGLFQAALGPFDLPEHARGGGLQYITGNCGEGFGYDMACLPDLADKSAAWTENGTTTVLGAPFVVFATLQCGSAGLSPDELRDLTMDRLRSVEQAVVEEVFSTSTFGQSPGLTAADGIITVTGAGDTVGNVLSELERARYCGFTGNTAQYGQPAVLHVAIPVFNALKSEHLIDFDGTRWRTPMGTVVSSGCYANNDPAGVAPADGVFWMYITGQTAIWRSSDQFVRENIPGPEGTLDRTTNQYMMIAEREYVVTYECGGFAKAVTLWT